MVLVEDTDEVLGRLGVDVVAERVVRSAAVSTVPLACDAANLAGSFKSASACSVAVNGAAAVSAALVAGGGGGGGGGVGGI